MKALTICQPYAELIARGDKRVENRTWWTHYRGALAIHAGASKKWMPRTRGRIDYRECAEYEFGAVIAVAQLVDCLAYARGDDGRWLGGFHDARWLADDPHASGPCCWVLADVRRLPKPIPLTGRQGLWNLPEEIARALA